MRQGRELGDPGVELVFVNAVSSASAAARTSSTAWEELTDPDASSTRVSSRPQDCSIGGFGSGGTAAAAGLLVQSYGHQEARAEGSPQRDGAELTPHATNGRPRRVGPSSPDAGEDQGDEVRRQDARGDDRQADAV